MRNLTGPSQGSAEQFITLASSRGSQRPADVAVYLHEVYRLAHLAGIPAHIVACQSIHETDWWRSEWWQRRCNPAGIGITGTRSQNEASKDFGDGVTAARAHLVHLGLYIFGATLPEALRPYQALDPRWDAAIQIGYAGKARVLADLTGTWATDAREPHDPLTYDEKLERLLNALGFTTTESPAMKPCILLVSGHRSTNDGGDATERALTDDLAIAYERACTTAGYPVSWFQRDHDGDHLPDLTQGSLNTVALGVGQTLARLTARHELVIMADLHFNGSTSGVHVVVPHNRRQDGRDPLNTAYVQGRVTADVAENNTLDVTLASTIAREIVRSVPGMTLWRANRSGAAGVMLENETRVGDPYADDNNDVPNSRLAMMSATAPYRKNTVRITIEHGGTNDARRPDFFNRCATAFVRAVDDVLAERERLAEKLQSQPERRPAVPQPEPKIAPVS